MPIFQCDFSHLKSIHFLIQIAYIHLIICVDNIYNNNVYKEGSMLIYMLSLVGLQIYDILIFKPSFYTHTENSNYKVRDRNNGSF